MQPRWCYVVESQDRATGLTSVERFMFPADAHARAELLRRMGLWNVRVRERRMSAAGGTAATRPGFYGQVLTGG